jgi:ADP-ribosylglycohydrolase
MQEPANRQRALGALAGVAVGDAMGMPTQTLSIERIARVYGSIEGFRDASPDQPVSAGLKAGTITDDTEQSLLLARHLIARGGRVDQKAWANELLAWERETHARGVNDLLGPSTKRAIAALQAGVPASEAGRTGTTNGAAMRIVPVAIATPPVPMASLVDAVEESCRLTHATSEAIGAASAVAAAVSAGIEGADLPEVLDVARAAAAEGERRGAAPLNGLISTRIAEALALAQGCSGRDAAVAIARQVGTSVSALQSVPMAFAILQLVNADPWQAAQFSAIIGDDTDTIGAIACGMSGAISGIGAIPPPMWKLVQQVNGLDIEPVVSGLLAIRAMRSGGAA